MKTNRLAHLTLLLVALPCLLSAFGCRNRRPEEMAQTRETSPIDLNEYRWKNRPVLVFASNPEDAQFKEQMRDLQSRNEEIEDRDILIFELVSEGQSKVAGQPISNADSASLWDELQVSRRAFAFILVGKDGTVKLRSERPVPSRQVFSLIDSMPMRQAEMRGKGRSGSKK
jgi:hypothetical protein